MIAPSNSAKGNATLAGLTKDANFINEQDVSGKLATNADPAKAVRGESCVMIKQSWKETGGNVSLVARRLGVSRNTVYKHVREA